MVLGFEGAGPDGTIGDVIDSCVAVVAGRAPEGFEGGLHCFGRVSMAKVIKWRGDIAWTEYLRRREEGSVRTYCACTAHAQC